MWYRKFIRMKNMKFILILFLISYFSVYYYKVGSAKVQDNKVKISYVVVHLDMKGAPPKLSYLMEMFPTWKKLGVNGLLIEYEDMFPYEGALTFIRSKFSYNKHDLSNFLLDAVKHGFEIIPLIQTFGHLEFVLKQERYRHLREEPGYNDVLCPTQDESFMLIKQMLTQVLLFHQALQPLRFIHIGCDEVYHIKKCPYCKKRKITRNQIFQEAVNKTQSFIRYLLPDVTVLIWDDMLRKRNKNINNLIIEPVVWHYEPNPELSHVDLYRYHKKFKDMWLATAFKGAETSTSLIPDIYRRYSNHYNMMKFIKGYKFGGSLNTYNFKGIILTGWSRYTHMTPIVDLLPAAYPSLVINLLLIRKILNSTDFNLLDTNPNTFFTENLAKDAAKFLNCVKVERISDISTANCKFSGSRLHDHLSTILKIRDHFFRSGDYNIYLEMEYYNRTGYMNSNWIDFVYGPLQKKLQKVIAVETSLKNIMAKYYNDHVIQEYTNYVTFSLKNVLSRNLNIMNTYKKIETWQDRKEVKLNCPDDKGIKANERNPPKSFFLYYFD